MLNVEEKLRKVRRFFPQLSFKKPNLSPVLTTKPLLRVFFFWSMKFDCDEVNVLTQILSESQGNPNIMVFYCFILLDRWSDDRQLLFKLSPK